mmetsp:Transcript_2968/g.11685  ORF Transcript_2968/g.11685 Transcript_2968/m.11685 type:complete len:201 (-) Transcript_2968:2919-3521(-)
MSTGMLQAAYPRHSHLSRPPSSKLPRIESPSTASHSPARRLYSYSSTARVCRGDNGMVARKDLSPPPPSAQWSVYSSPSNSLSMIADHVHWMNEIQYSQIHMAWMVALRMKNPPTSMFSVVYMGRHTAGPTSPAMPLAMVNPTSIAMAKLTKVARTKKPNRSKSSLRPMHQYRTAANAPPLRKRYGISVSILAATYVPAR